jgi:hypothetical protein
MKKLKKKMLSIKLQKVRAPGGMTLKEYTAFYASLVRKYGDSKNLKILYRGGYYGAYWLVERRMETDAELAKRQTILDKKIARRQAEIARYRAARKIEAAARRESDKRHKLAMKKAAMERKVEEVKTMVNVLKAAGYVVSYTRV